MQFLGLGYKTRYENLRKIYIVAAPAVMNSIRETAVALWQNVARLLSTRRETAPIDSVAKLEDFVGSRAAYVAQKTLYGYVKARMGIRYPAMFENDDVAASLNLAKLNVFAACLSDLTVYAVGNALYDRPVGNDAREALARRCYQAALCEIVGAEPVQFSTQDAIDQFERRLIDVDWRKGAREPENFTASPRALFRWSPIADELKQFDTEIVENSIKFAWRDIREQFRKRIDAAAVGEDWSRQSES